MMNEKQIKQKLDILYNKYKEGGNIKILIAQAFTLGMNYREEQIRDGINIVFNALHEPINSNSQKNI